MDAQVVGRARRGHTGRMDGFLLETTRTDDEFPEGREVLRWIGIAPLARDLPSMIVGRNPRMVASGPEVFARARAMGLSEGEVRRLED